MPKHRFFYAADNRCSSSTDIGFYNGWYVLVFESKTARDSYVENACGLAAKAITRKEVTQYAGSGRKTPQPFTNEAWGIRKVNSDNAIGVIETVDFSEAYIRALPDIYQRFYK